MIDLPPAGGGIRTCDLVVASRVQPHWAVPVTPSKWYPKYPLVPKIPSFLRDHLFVTTRVATRDGNFLIGAPFVSDRPRHLFFRPNKSVLGPVDVVGPFSTIFVIFSGFFVGGTAQIQERKK